MWIGKHCSYESCESRGYFLILCSPVKSQLVPISPTPPPSIHWSPAPNMTVFGDRAFKGVMAPHSSTLAWKIPWAEEPGRLQNMGLLRVGNNWATSLSLFTFMHWRRKWQPTPVFLPRESQGLGNLVGCRLWGRTESDMTEVMQQQQQQQQQSGSHLIPLTPVIKEKQKYYHKDFDF